MTHAEMQTRATRYYENRLRRMHSLFPKSENVWDATEFFRTVQAGLSAIVPGKQRSKTEGWLKMCLAAHKAAARQLGAPQARGR